MKNYLYYDDETFVDVLNLNEVKELSENLFNKIISLNFGINVWNELVLAEEMEYKEVYEIKSDYTQEELRTVLKQDFYINVLEIAKVLGEVKKII